MSSPYDKMRAAIQYEVAFDDDSADAILAAIAKVLREAEIEANNRNSFLSVFGDVLAFFTKPEVREPKCPGCHKAGGGNCDCHCHDEPPQPESEPSDDDGGWGERERFLYPAEEKPPKPTLEERVDAMGRILAALMQGSLERAAKEREAEPPAPAEEKPPQPESEPTQTYSAVKTCLVCMQSFYFRIEYGRPFPYKCDDCKEKMRPAPEQTAEQAAEEYGIRIYGDDSPSEANGGAINFLAGVAWAQEQKRCN
jgi:hypothetical protein